MSTSGRSSSFSGKKKSSSDDLPGRISQSDPQVDRVKHGKAERQSRRSIGDSEYFPKEQSDLPPQHGPHLQFTQTSFAASRDVARNVKLVPNARAERQNCTTGSQYAPAARPQQLSGFKAPARPNGLALFPAGREHKARSSKRPGIVVVHSRAFFRDCFSRCLEISYEGYDISAFESIEAWRSSKKQNALIPAVIVFFVEDNSASSIADIELLESTAAGIPIAIISNIDDTNFVMHAFKGGVRGYIPTSLPYNVAVEAVRLVVAGGTFVPASSLNLNHQKLETATRLNDLLTERQMKVAEALCQGMANKQIAYELSMSEHTVKVHLRHIMRKLNARNRTEVAVLTKTMFLD